MLSYFTVIVPWCGTKPRGPQQTVHPSQDEEWVKTKKIWRRGGKLFSLLPSFFLLPLPPTIVPIGPNLTCHLILCILQLENRF